jgi:glycosyltransferase involved in cell wall biosynthesis
VGDGPERAKLEHRAPGNTRFLGRLPDQDVRDLYQRAAVVLLPGEEDFGIVPVEAQACGRPVVALGRGGACETVVDGETGLLVNEPGVEAFAARIAEAVARRFDPDVIRQHAKRFGRDRFGDEMVSTATETAASGRARW